MWVVEWVVGLRVCCGGCGALEPEEAASFYSMLQKQKADVTQLQNAETADKLDKHGLAASTTARIVVEAL